MSVPAAGMPAGEEVVRIDVPATSAHLRLVRLVVAGISTDHGADVDDLEDLRMATGELCTHLVGRAGDGQRLHVEMTVSTSDGSDRADLRVEARVDGLADPGSFDELSALVLSTTASDHGIELGPRDVVVWFRRPVRAERAPAAGREGGRLDDD